MSCIIKINLGSGSPITFEVEESVLGKEATFVSSRENTDENTLLYNILLAAKDTKLEDNKTEFDIIKRRIISYLNGIYPGTLEVSNIESGIVPNTNTDYLKELYPDIDFPKDIKFPVLLVDKYAKGDYGFLDGKIYTTKGSPIYVVHNSKASVMRLAKHLELRSKIKGKASVLENLEESFKKELEELAKAIYPETKNIKDSILDMLLDYSENVSKYNKMKEPITSLGRTPKFVLEEALNIINESLGIQRYKNKPLLNLVTSSIKFGKNETYLDLNAVCDYMRRIKFLKHITTNKQFIETFNKPISELNLEDWKPAEGLESDFKALMELSIVDANANTNSLVLFLLNLFELRDTTDPLFRYEGDTLKTDGKNYKLLLRNKFPSYESVYGITYDSIKKAIPVSTVGSWTIYEYLKDDQIVYLPSRHVLRETDQALIFLSQEEAEEYARNKGRKETLREAALGNSKKLNKDTIEGRTFMSPLYFPNGAIIKSIDAYLDLDDFKGDARILLDKSLEDFHKYIIELKDSNDLPLSNAMEIIRRIDSAEKVLVFLSKLGDKEKTAENMNKALEEVEGLGYKYYYVRKSYPTDGEYVTHVIPMDNSYIENPPKDPRTPVILLLDLVAKMMHDKFKVEVKVLTLTEINDLKLDNGLEINEGAKAFIYKGVIYINSTYASNKDLFHEYAHLFMGIIKARNPEWYILTLDYIIKTDKKALYMLLAKRKTLHRSYYDAAEEVFADLYGEYLEDRLPITLENIFNNLIIKDTTHSIFDLADSESNIEDLLRYSKIDSLFKRFSSDIAKAFSKNNNLLHNDELALQRRKANWLEKLLKTGEIIEEGC